MLVTKRPLSFYLLIIIAILFFAICITQKMNIFASILYCSLISSLFYYIFCRYSCIVVIENNKLRINYLFPWNKDIQFDLKCISKFYYRNGFYSPFSDNSVIIGGINFCFDTLVFKIKDDETDEKIIKINTRLFFFDRIIEKIEESGVQLSCEPYNKLF